MPQPSVELVSTFPLRARGSDMKSVVRSADFQSGLVFLALAALGLWLASGLRLGTAMRMGSGHLPMLFSALLLVLGLSTVLTAFLRPGAGTERWYLRPLVGVLASLATRESRWIEVLMVGLGLAAFSTAVFVWMLALSIPAWPPGMAS